jgi:hypothetical protein
MMLRDPRLNLAADVVGADYATRPTRIASDMGVSPY